MKLRAMAAGWLNVVIKEWELGERSREQLEECLLLMVADGNAEVRSGGRRSFSCFAQRQGGLLITSTWPTSNGRAESACLYEYPP